MASLPQSALCRSPRRSFRRLLRYRRPKGSSACMHAARVGHVHTSVATKFRPMAARRSCGVASMQASAPQLRCYKPVQRPLLPWPGPHETPRDLHKQLLRTCAALPATVCPSHSRYTLMVYTRRKNTSRGALHGTWSHPNGIQSMYKHRSVRASVCSETPSALLPPRPQPACRAQPGFGTLTRRPASPREVAQHSGAVPLSFQTARCLHSGCT